MGSHTGKRFLGKATLDEILEFTKGKTIACIERKLDYWEITFTYSKEPVVFEPDIHAVSRIMIRFTIGGMKLEKKHGNTE